MYLNSHCADIKCGNCNPSFISQVEASSTVTANGQEDSTSTGTSPNPMHNYEIDENEVQSFLEHQKYKIPAPQNEI